MPENPPEAPETRALSTKVEEDFVSPLTAVRGSLEILRDFPDLEPDKRRAFIDAALRECTRLEQGVEDLAAAVYAAARRPESPATAARAETSEYANRVHVLPELDVIELDFSDFQFDSAGTVNAFFDHIEEIVDATGRDWYFLVNYRDCTVWPEAWVAFAHRGKRISVNHAHGTLRYAETSADDDAPTATPGAGSDLYPSRDAALARIAEMRAA